MQNIQVVHRCVLLFPPVLKYRGEINILFFRWWNNGADWISVHGQKESTASWQSSFSGFVFTFYFPNPSFPSEISICCVQSFNQESYLSTKNILQTLFLVNVAFTFYSQTFPVSPHGLVWHYFVQCWDDLLTARRASSCAFPSCLSPVSSHLGFDSFPPSVLLPVGSRIPALCYRFLLTVLFPVYSPRF